MGDGGRTLARTLSRTQNKLTTIDTKTQTSRPVPSRPVPSRPVPSRPVPSRPVPSRPVPSRPVPSRPVPSRPVPRPVPSRPVTSRPVPSRHVPSRHVTSRHVTSRHVTSRHVTSRHVTSRHVTSRHVTSRHVTSHHITSHHITSHHITSHHITSHHITSHVTSHHITSHHITSHHITSHHITSHHTTGGTHQSRFSLAVSSKRRFTCSQKVWMSTMSARLSGSRSSNCSAGRSRLPFEHPIRGPTVSATHDKHTYTFTAPSEARRPMQTSPPAQISALTTRLLQVAMERGSCPGPGAFGQVRIGRTYVGVPARIRGRVHPRASRST